jgi:hypothetical protein
MEVKVKVKVKVKGGGDLVELHGEGERGSSPHMVAMERSEG